VTRFFRAVYPPSLTSRLVLTSNLDALRNEIDDPSYIPDWIDPELGTPFLASPATAGDYRRFVYEGEEFTFNEIFNRPVEEVDAELATETKLLSPVEVTLPGLGGSFGEEGEEESEMII